jgi:hypothetical protein
VDAPAGSDVIDVLEAASADAEPAMAAPGDIEF